MAHRQENGCIPCTNCVVAVPEDKFYAVEKFGRYSHMLDPGLAWAGLDCCGCCVSFRTVNARVDQITVSVATKTKDNVFVSVSVAVQQSVKPDCAWEAMYKLASFEDQIDSYVSHVVRSQLPRMTLDEAFERKDDISEAVQSKLLEQMAAYGFQIHKALVTEVTPDQAVVQAMNEINKQKRLRDAQVMAAEADKIKVVKAAEAAADAAQLAGEGTARQRKAIIDGLRESITTGSSEQLSTDKVSELLLITQYFETLRDIAAQSKAQTVFLPHGAGAVADVAAQVRRGSTPGPGKAPAGSASPSKSSAGQQSWWN